MAIKLVEDDTTEQYDGGNFGCHFAFDEKDEREDILKSLGLEYSKESPENMEMLKDLKKGQC
ncbi:ATP-binding protein, partial [Staphylococcus aureus]